MGILIILSVYINSLNILKSSKNAWFISISYKCPKMSNNVTQIGFGTMGHQTRGSCMGEFNIP